MNNRYIYHHLGLGDHIICNGLVRHIHKNCDNNIILFCYAHNLENLKFMYRDLNRFELKPMSSDAEIDNFITTHNVLVHKIGFNHLDSYMPKFTFDEAFYKIAGISFVVRFNEFYIERDFQREENVYNELNPNNEKYIFVHDDSSRGYSIDRSRLPTEYKIIENDMKYSVFDFMKIIENAEEIHMMQSSFKELVNSYRLPKPKIFSHNYVRQYPDCLNSIGLNNITILN